MCAFFSISRLVNLSEEWKLHVFVASFSTDVCEDEGVGRADIGFFGDRA